MTDSVTDKKVDEGSTTHTIERNALLKAWAWAIGKVIVVWGALAAFFASATVCPFCGNQGCPTGAGLYATILTVIYGITRFRRGVAVRNPHQHKHE